MNVSLMMMDTVCSGPVRGAPTPSKARTDDDHKPFSLIRENMSPEVRPWENVTSNKTARVGEGKSTEKALRESDDATSRKTDAGAPPTDRDDHAPKETDLVSDTNVQPDSEVISRTEECKPEEQSNAVTNEQPLEIEVFSSNPALKRGDSIQVSDEASEPIATEAIAAEASQGTPEGVPMDASGNTPAASDSSKMEQNVNSPTPAVPNGTTAHVIGKTNTQSDSESADGASAGTGGTSASRESTPTDGDSAPAIEVPQQLGSNTKDSIFNSLVDPESETTGNLQEAMSDQAKTSETQLHVTKAASDKDMSVGETVSKQNDPTDEESADPEDHLLDANPEPRASNPRFEDGTPSTQQNHSSDDNGPQARSEQTFTQSAANRFVAYDSRFSDSSVEANTPTTAQKPQMENSEWASSGQTSTDVGKQVLESIQSTLSGRGSDQQITVQLNPPELGRVSIRFQEQNNELTGHLEVNKPETRAEIEHALPQMIRNLADCGIHIKRIDVTLSQHDRPQYGATGDSLPQNSWSQQGNSADSQAWDKDAYTDGVSEWSPNNTYERISELQEIPAGDGSVNVLI
jgi:flagellar hook-length control protein FliK